MREIPFCAPGLPEPHEYGDGADWPGILIERLEALGCKLEARDDCLCVWSRGPLPTWEAQLLRTWGDVARKRLLDAALA
jgi:hypothetical protein